ncbi:MAG TPA: hypothetical protein VFQ84_06105 [Arenimonas sp.]|uniref:hypothetical protein n=1 Tax=Arenimonas sp. TaxID=1872635 RepID=UPI002D7F4A34|nr:hypothetical protein [Arenimonas sp.]HEU0152899.1 hypothetical protein [Arenimonas sp.]
MNRSSIALGILIGCAVLAGSVGAASGDSREQQRRSDLVLRIVEKWGEHVEGAYARPAEAWSKDMVPLLMRTPMASLQRAADARTFEEMNDALLAKAAPVPEMPRADLARPRVSGSSAAQPAEADATPQAIGDASRDLVYVPVTPCRVIDTRLAGGPIPAGGTRDFDIAAATDYTAQGGAATNCNVGNVGTIGSAVINFTVVTPSIAGFITAYEAGGTLPLAATVNYVAGDIRGNLAIVPLDSSSAGADISVYTFAQTHVVGDIVGYFIAPQATGLDCTATFVTQNVAANGVFDIAIPACPVSYAVTGAGCRTPGFNEANWAINGLYLNNGSMLAFCSGQNTTAGVITVEGTAQCCRVPGR